MARDPSADGAFVYAVASTGVYCRPSCAARTPRPENVVFYTDPDAAERAGFRACRRCRPDRPPLAERRAAVVAGLCRYIDRCETPPTVAALAERAGWSPSHLHRVFRAVAGLTPKDYIAGRRSERLRTALDGAGSVTDAIYAAGFGSAGRFYDAMARTLGMTPTRWRGGGRGETIRFAVGQCALGAILVAATGRGVCAVSLGDAPETLLHGLEERFPRADLAPGDARFDARVAQVVALIERPATGPVLPLDVRGTAFQIRVWAALTRIPFGVTRSYAELAEAIGAPRSARAVANACGRNPIALAIPCHRVVRTDGGISGYRWGVERKRCLLAGEASRER